MASEAPLAFAPSVLGGAAEPCPHCGRDSGRDGSAAAAAREAGEAAGALGAAGAAEGGDCPGEHADDALPFCCADCRAVHGAVHTEERSLLQPALLLLCSLEEDVVPLSRLVLVLRLLLRERVSRLPPHGQCPSKRATASTMPVATDLSDHLTAAFSQEASAPYLAQAKRASAGLADLLIASAPEQDGSTAALAREALRLFMVVRVNGFELGGGSGGCALFPRIAAINHDCAPNCCTRWDRAEGRLEVRALQQIRVNEEITISYLGLDSDSYAHNVAGDGTAAEEAGERRRTRLRETKYFECDCATCRGGR